MNKLIKMILESKAIDTPEGKQHWINQLEIMTPEQKEKLKDILTNENKKLKEIQDKYDKKKKAVINKTIKDNNLSSLMAI